MYNREMYRKMLFKIPEERRRKYGNKLKTNQLKTDKNAYLYFEEHNRRTKHQKSDR